MKTQVQKQYRNGFITEAAAAAEMNDKDAYVISRSRQTGMFDNEQPELRRENGEIEFYEFGKRVRKDAKRNGWETVYA